MRIRLGLWKGFVGFFAGFGLLNAFERDWLMVLSNAAMLVVMLLAIRDARRKLDADTEQS